MQHLYSFLLLARCTFASPLFTGLKTQLQTRIQTTETSHTHPELWSPAFWEKIVISIVLVLLGGVFAGLTLGLMGLDDLHLRVLATSSADEDEKKNAKMVLQLMQNGRHWVLVVLLLANVIVNESLPIFLDNAIGGGFAAVALSTTAIAVSVRYGLTIGAACAPFVLCLMYLFAPIAYPIARILDAVLGTHETHTYKKAELKSFLQFHRSGEEPLRDDEISILNGVLELNTKHVEEIMTPMKALTLSADAVLDDEHVEAILLSGYSRIPVHESHDPEAFIGLLLVKKLIKYDPALALPRFEFPAFNLTRGTSEHQLLPGAGLFPNWARAPAPRGAIGVLTLEDIIEEILSEEIVDETDRYEDNVTKQMATRMTRESVMRDIVELHQRGVPVSVSSADRTPVIMNRVPSLTGEHMSLLNPSQCPPSIRSLSAALGRGGYGSTQL
ncbi:hypothetical protein MVEN_01285400 [Mycena venus]|uniref:CNNM transmembrane domain-containing protein n=1 Tax=Mycena venus TaxID=2733690 RepID=A0A8H6Y0S6_9AGAR|nr:hypothetical protein MVEN_01285400 [Mycena venus]